MRLTAFVLAIVSSTACAARQTPERPELGFGSGIQCNAPGGFASAWELADATDINDFRVGLTLDSPNVDEKWRPTVWVMLADGPKTDAVRVDLWQAQGSETLELRALRVRQGKFTWNTQLASGLPLGMTRDVAIDWSRVDEIVVRVGEDAPITVPIDFKVSRILAGCSSASGAIWVPAIDPS